MPPFINDDLISKNLGKTLVLTWTIQKCERCNVYLDFHNQHGNIVSWLFDVSNNQVSKSDFAQKKFGDRINVTWVGRTFKVELKYLQNNDTGNFSVSHYCPGEHVSSYPSCILITEAQGMYRFTSEFMHYDIACFETLVASLHCNTTNPTSTYTLSWNICRKIISHVLEFLQKELIPFQHQLFFGYFEKLFQTKSFEGKHLLPHIRISKVTILKQLFHSSSVGVFVVRTESL